MYKLLIVDDEPLVQVGLKSMLDWEELGIEICGTASNGQTAFNIIHEQHPELIICDIKMPTMSGLELIKLCQTKFGELPLFIMLTSFEEFEFARESLRYGAVEYLVKLELTKEVLTDAVTTAIERVEKIQATNKPAEETASFDFNSLQNRFYMRLISNLLEDEEVFYQQAEELHLPFSAASYIAAHLELTPPENATSFSTKQQITLYTNTLNMFQQIMNKYIPCKVISLDLKYFAVLFFLPESSAEKNKKLLEQTVQQTADMLYNYYNVKIHTAFGSFVKKPIALSLSYRDARNLMPFLTNEQPLLFNEYMPEVMKEHNTFDMALFRKDIQKAFEEYDAAALHDVFSSIFTLFSSDHLHYPQLMDAASNLIQLSLTLLSNGPDVLSTIFREEPDGYRSLYNQTSVPLVLDWMKRFEAGLADTFTAHKKDYKNRTVANIKTYIHTHIDEHLTLQKVASVFNLSPNYLSQLFKKYSEMGFNEYVTAMKIEKAKTLLRNGNPKVYEIAEQLGFENAFYFSKVFKKSTGISPKEYAQK